MGTTEKKTNQDGQFLILAYKKVSKEKNMIIIWFFGILLSYNSIYTSIMM